MISTNKGLKMKTYSMNDIISKIADASNSLKKLPNEARNILTRRIEIEKMQKQLKEIDIDINNLDEKHFLLGDIIYGDINNSLYITNYNKQDYFDFTKFVCFDSDLLEKEKTILLNSMVQSYSAPSLWLNIFSSFNEKEQDKIVPCINTTDMIFFRHDSQIDYNDQTINILKKMIEHHKGENFLRYRTIIALGIRYPDDKLFNIVDKDIFNYICNSNNSSKANAIIFHLTNNFIRALENNQNEEKNRIEKLVSIEFMYKIIDCIDNNLKYFQNTQPVVIIARNFFLKELTARGIRDNQYFERQSSVDVGCDYADIDNINCLTMYIEKKSSNVLPPEFYTSIEQEILNHTIKSSPDNIQHKKVRL